LSWEISNVFSSMLKMRCFTLTRVQEALCLYQRIPVRLAQVSLPRAPAPADQLNIYAHDAYILACGEQQRCPLLSLDQGLLQAARPLRMDMLEV
jgi:predicted nucleic acid-binding protein